MENHQAEGPSFQFWVPELSPCLSIEGPALSTTEGEQSAREKSGHCREQAIPHHLQALKRTPSPGGWGARLGGRRGEVVRELIDKQSERRLTFVMDATSQETLFPMPEPTVAQELMGWQERADKLQEMARERGGLIPRAAMADTLQTSKQRVAQLIDDGSLEILNFFGVQFVTGRSIREHLAVEKLRGGRGKKKPLGVWRELKIGSRVASGLAHAVMGK